MDKWRWLEISSFLIYRRPVYNQQLILYVQIFVSGTLRLYIGAVLQRLLLRTKCHLTPKFFTKSPKGFCIFTKCNAQCSHGNLTPRTILIASSQPVRMMIKLYEFGLSKLSNCFCKWTKLKIGNIFSPTFPIFFLILLNLLLNYPIFLVFRNFTFFFPREVNLGKKSRQSLIDQCDEELGKEERMGKETYPNELLDIR